MYLLGDDFTVVTDHRPLVSLFNSPSKPGPFRVERVRLKLQGFRFTVIHKPGKWNPSDYLSRHPLPLSILSQEEFEECHEFNCHAISLLQSNVLSALSLHEIQEETEKDPVLRKILLGLRHNELDASDPEMIHYKKIIGEFS